MIKLLHTGDMHLKAPPSEDSGYSLQCLGVLIRQANEDEVDAVLLCGDMFDKKSDYSDKEFVARVVAIFDKANMPIYYIPGNHEAIDGNFTKLQTINWGKRLTLLSKVSLETFSKDEEKIEILAIPHSPDYEAFAEWVIPKKQQTHRISIAHGEIPGFTFLGDEDGAGVLNPSLFIHHEVSHVFLGHVHLAQNLKNTGINFYYAGSPRPVRRKETGERGYNLIEIDQTVRVKRQVFSNMGTVHRITATVLGEDWVSKIVNGCEALSENDRIHVILEGLVEDVDEMDAGISTLTKILGKSFRRVTVDKQLEPLDDLIQNPFYKQVYDHWLAHKPNDATGHEFQVWIQMLNQLKFMKEVVLG